MLLPDLLFHYSLNRKISETTVTEFALSKAQPVSQYIIPVQVFEYEILELFSSDFVKAVISRVIAFTF